MAPAKSQSHKRRKRAASDAAGADIDAQGSSARAATGADAAFDVTLAPGAVAVIDGACAIRCVDGQCDAHGYEMRANTPAVIARSVCGVDRGVTVTAGAGGARVRGEPVEGATATCRAQTRETSTTERDWTPTVITHHWRTVAENIVGSDSERGVACVAFVGPKGVGKSTFARFVANGLVSRGGACAWLDLDCGQPELTAPGLVSLTYLRQPLLGAPQTHQASGAEFAGAPATTFSASFVGDVSPQSDPDAYVRGALRCVDAWKALGDARPPMVINTSGWVKGLGLELTEEVLRAVGTCAADFYVVNINSHVASRNAPSVEWFCDYMSPDATKPSVQTFEVAAGYGTAPNGADADVEETSAETYESGGGAKSKDPRRSASDSRALSWLAWSKQAVAMCNNCPSQGALDFEDGGEIEAFNAVAADLTRSTPWKVSLDDIVIHLLHADLPAREALMAINGAIVGLLKAPAPGDERGCAECLGLGLVRGVDAARRYAYILTPLPNDKLKHVETLALGKLEFPPRLLGVAGEFPYMHVGTIANIGSGSKAIKSRNNIVRSSALRR